MKSTITITNIKNINYNEMCVINYDLIEKRTYDTLMDVFLFEHKSGEQRRSNLMDVSLYDDVIVEGTEKYKILHMLSK